MNQHHGHTDAAITIADPPTIKRGKWHIPSFSSKPNAPDQARPKAVACIRKLETLRNHSGHRSSAGRCRIGDVAILEAVIFSDPNILGGTPVFRGTRVPLKNLVDYLAAGDSLDEFLDHFPSVKREQAVAVLELAAKELLQACARPSR